MTESHQVTPDNANPPATTSMNEASHVLSNKSRLLDRDTFVFASLNPCPSRLLLGMLHETLFDPLVTVAQDLIKN